jgi:hypothetical protein
MFGTYNLNKEMISLIVVFFDIGAAYCFFIAFIILKLFQIVTHHEINEEVVVASDFSVQIEGLP